VRIYRDELVAAHARIAELEAVLARVDEDAVVESPRFAALRAQRADVMAQGRRFAGLGPNGLAALVVLAFVLGSIIFLASPAGFAPHVVAFMIGALLMTMVATVVRVGRQADMNNRVAAIDEKIDALTQEVEAERAARRVRVTTELGPPMDDEVEQPTEERLTLERR